MIETEFTPLASLGGGAIIGAASVLLMLVAGRIMGATGILTGLVAPASRTDITWRAVLLAGMVSGPAAYFALTGALPAIDVPIGTPALVIGGLIVGMGVTWGAGCTSGHGVCGLARGSARSLVATATFMVATFATVYVTRHLIGA